MHTIDEAVQLATSFAQRGDHAEAIRILRQVHAHAPGNLVVMRGLGISLANGGDLEGSIPYLLQVAQNECTSSNVMALLTVLRALRQIPNMDTVCAGSYSHVGDDPDFLSTWGYVKLQLGQLAEAEEILRKGLSLYSDNSQIIHNLSAVLISQGKGEDAVAVFSGAVRPWLGDAGKKDLLAEYSVLSSSYDENSLHHYFTEKIVAITDNLDGGALSGDILDLGCGSGLLSVKLGGRCRKLIGIDLSPDMARHARTRGGYSDVICESLDVALERIQDWFDVAVSAAVLCHIADLRPIFSGVSKILRPGGMFIFSTDPCLDNIDIGISPSGDYCHSRRYLRNLAVEADLSEVQIQIANHRGTPGFWCAFRKRLPA